MKIAIIAPSAVPFARGGAENLYQGLLNFINDETPHQGELIKLPSREHSFFELMHTYREFTRLDLSHFDLVIATKYPSWMVPHHNMAVYMLHTLRGLYDTYHFMGQPIEVSGLPEPVDAVFGQLCAYEEAGTYTHESACEIIDRFLAFAGSELAGEPCFGFPGALIRRVLHYLDHCGMAREKVSSYASISRTVAEREDYFPKGADVKPLYPPTLSKGFYCAKPEHVFTVSRLDGPKRIAMLVEAFARVDHDIPFIIAGDGPERERIAALAEKDERVRLVGKVSDTELADYYAKSLFIPFIPYDEDYGYITIEAMLSAKPVLTTTDSGGPHEFVRDGETGVVTEPDVDSLAAGMRRLVGDYDATAAMGEAAVQSVAAIDWKTVVEGLSGERLVPKCSANSRVILSEPAIIKGQKPKLVLASTFPIYPARGGGQTRIFNFYSRLAKWFDVEIVSLAFPDTEGKQGEIAPGVYETVVKASEAHRHEEIEMMRTVDWIPLTDIAFGDLWHLTPDLEAALRERGHDAYAMVDSHPFSARMLREVFPNKPLWSESHNFEYKVKQDIFPDTDGGRAILDKVFEIEKFAWVEADRVYACTDSDIISMSNAYGNTNAPKHVVPNGVSLRDSFFVTPSMREEAKKKLKLAGQRTALFLGSYHPPNIESIEFLISIAHECPDVKFLIVGSACHYFQDRELPQNLIMYFVVDDDVKSDLIAASDVALNPMFSGSGSNLKMFDYMAYGAPVLSTEFGMRGMDSAASTILFQAEKSNFVFRLKALLDADQIRQDSTRAARDFVAANYDWDVIANRFLAEIGIVDDEVDAVDHEAG